MIFHYTCGEIIKLKRVATVSAGLPRDNSVFAQDRVISMKVLVFLGTAFVMPPESFTELSGCNQRYRLLRQTQGLHFEAGREGTTIGKAMN